MRFSSIFQPKAPEPRKASVQGSAPPEPAAGVVAKPAEDLPDDLDARVRLVGEWQLGEG